MSAGWPAKQELPPDTRPHALVLHGLSRGALIVFLPVFVAGQAIAWVTYAISHWYRPWSWFKIGLAEALASVRVAFTTADVSTRRATHLPALPHVGPAVLQVAIGALTVAVVVLAYRAGREQAAGLERRPLAAALAGSTVGLGFAIPMLVAALPVDLTFPQFDVRSLQPVLWQAFVFPLVVGAACGAVGGLARARVVVEGSAWGARLARAARGGFLAFWLAAALAFIGFLLVAVFEPNATGAYARWVDHAKGSGTVTIVQHALLLPNQSVMIATTSMGAPTTFSIGTEPAARLTLGGIEPVGNIGRALMAFVGAQAGEVTFPGWFRIFLLVPAIGTILGGRRAGTAAATLREALVRGAIGGVVYAMLVAVGAWAASIVLPPWAGFFGGSIRLGVAAGTAAALALLWGIAGGVAGAALARRWPERPSSAEVELGLSGPR
ncbi:MAG TPA: hypothetical protein VK646_09815 [Actinomycetota bacterium]|nr:hypothetical protein [Actinomycetota bacterium]